MIHACLEIGLKFYHQCILFFFFEGLILHMRKYFMEVSMKQFEVDQEYVAVCQGSF